MGEFVRLEVADGVGTIRLDRPKMNAISTQVQRDLFEVAAIATDPPAATRAFLAVLGAAA